MYPLGVPLQAHHPIFSKGFTQGLRIKAVFSNSRFYLSQSPRPKRLPVPSSTMQSNGNLHHENYSASQGEAALEDHCLALRQLFMQVGTLLEEKDLERERLRQEEADWLTGGTAPCTHPDCPITIPHNNGRYLHDNQPYIDEPTRLRNERYPSRPRRESYTWHPLFGACNPPPSVWEALRRIESMQGSERDSETCMGFMEAHVVRADDEQGDDEDTEDPSLTWRTCPI